MNTPQPASARYFYVLDFARGFGALAVAFWHYKGFFNVPGTTELPAHFDLSQQPAFTQLSWFYLYGEAAVQLFWALSGFVFASVYLGSRVSGHTFFRSRVARLYPLHLLTLSAIVVMQLALKVIDVNVFPFANNDLYHLFLNLLMAPAWGLEMGSSFNFPFWSVSVEVLIYAVYWLSLKPTDKAGPGIPLAALLLFSLLYIFAPHGRAIWYCGVFFFMGALVFQVPSKLGLRLKARLSFSVLTFILTYLASLLAPSLPTKAIALLLIPGTILLLSTIDPYAPRAVQRIGEWVGQCSYGIYLWHIPVQMVFIIFLELAKIDRSALAMNEWFLLLYICTTVIFARISFVYFELPAKLMLSIVRYRNPSSVHSSFRE